MIEPKNFGHLNLGKIKIKKLQFPGKKTREISYI